jgi:hypothetical protein
MVIFSIKPLSRRLNSCSDLSIRIILLLHISRYSLGDLRLLVVDREDSGSILRSSITSLSIQRSWVVCSVREFYQLGVRNFSGIERDFNGLCMPR